jgi:hypothetical protein
MLSETTDTIGSTATTNLDFYGSYMAGFDIVASSSGTLTSLGVNIHSTNGHNIALGIYSGHCSENGALISSTAQAASTTGWNYLSVAGGSISQGSTYCIVVEDGGGSYVKYYSSGSGTMCHPSGTLGNWPNNFPSGGCESWTTINMRMTYSGEITTTSTTSTSTTSTSTTTTTSTSTTTESSSTTATTTISGATDTIGSTATTNLNFCGDYIAGFDISASASGTLSSLGINIYSTNGKQIKLGLYSGSCSSNGSLIASTGLTASTTGWNDLSVSGGSVSQGLYCIAVEDGGGAVVTYYNSGTGTMCHPSSSYPSLPSTFPSGGCESWTTIHMRMTYS